MNALARILAISIALLGACTAHAANRSAVASGNWNSTAVWANSNSCTGATGASVPGAGDTVFICAGTTVTLNTNTAALKQLTINATGILQDDGTAGRTLTVGNSGLTNNGSINFSSGAVAALSANSAWGGTGTWTLGQINASGNTLSFANTGIVLHLSNATPIVASGSISNTTIATFDFNGTVAQTLPNSASILYGAITVNNTAGVTLGTALNTLNLVDNVSVQTGTLDNGGFAITGTAGKTFSVSNGASFKMTGTAVFPTGFTTFTFGASSNTRYLQTNAQNISARTYGNLEVSPTGNVTHTFTATATTVAGNLTVGNGANTSTADAGANNTPLTVSGNVSISANATLKGPASSTFGVAGNWTNAGTYTANTGTVTFNGTAAQAIGGSAVTSFANLTDSNTGAALSASTNMNVSGTMNMNGAATLFTPGPAVVINSGGAAGTLTGTGTVQVTRAAASSDFANQYKFTTYTLTNLTVEYIGTAAQEVSPTATVGTYSTLKISNTSAAVSASANFAVSGTLNMNGGATILAPAAAVIVSGAGTLTGTGTVRVTRTAATADFSSQYTITGKTLTNLTVEYIGTAAQVVSALTYGSGTGGGLTISNTSAAVSAAANFAVNGTLNMNGASTILTPAATVIVSGTGTLTGTGTVQVTRTAATADFSSQYTISTQVLSSLTVEYIGTAAQVVSALTYGSLTISNSSAAVTASSNFAVNGTLTMNGASTILSPAAAVIVSGAGTLTGTGTVQVTRTAATADFSSQYTIAAQTLTNLTVEYIGTAAQVVSALSYGSLKISNTSAAVTAASNFNVGGTLTMNGGATILAPAAAVVINNAAAAGTVTGTGTVRVTRTAATADFSSQYSFSTYTLTNLTVEYIGTAAQVVSALTYGNLTDSNVSGALSAAANFAVNGTLNMNGSATLLTPAAAVIVSGTGTLTGTGTLQVTRTAATADFSSQYTISNKTLTNLTVEYAGAAAQSVSAVTYGSGTGGGLKISNTSAAVSAAANFAVNGTLTMNGAGTLLTPGAAVIVSGTGTLTGTGTVQVTRTAATADFSTQYTITTKTLTNLTVEYIGTATQVVSALSYGSLKISNTSAAVTAASNFNVSGTLTMNGASTVLNPSSTVIINSAAAAGTVTGTGTVQVTRTAATADFGSQYKFSTYTLANLTVEYTGTAAQVVTGGLTYGNLTDSNISGAVSAAANFTVNGTLTMNGAATVLTPAAAVVVSGSGTLTGTGTVQVTRTAATADFSSQYTMSTLTLTNLTVEYIGSAAQIVSALTYGGLKINNASGATLATEPRP